MRLLLKDFQTDAVQKLLAHIHSARREAVAMQGQAISLSAPTASGKTIVMTALIEAILFGEGDYAGDPLASILWITDQPELNEQTRRKMLDTSSNLDSTRLLTVDASFDEEFLLPGTVHFLNVQKLGRDKQLVTPGDRRTYTMWQTIDNTICTRPGSLYVLIDEAHRGMGETAAGRREAATIVQKFIKGSSGEMAATPIIVGISATPERFERLIEGTDRTSRRCTVDTTVVRASGLLKETITLFHPTEDQPSDFTMLRAAVGSWQEYTKRWEAYSIAQGEPVVNPVLVVQAEDGSRNRLSNTDLAGALSIIDEECGGLPDAAYGHSFQEGTTLLIGEREIRYVSPSDVQSDDELKVILFKTSLNTGWDCPRAETMMSFRKSVDATSIAQLVGRMVRTPLARRIEADEYLNSVSLFLPHYDKAGLNRVVDKLTHPDPEFMPAVDVELGEDVLFLSRAKDSKVAFEALESIPSYVVPKKIQANQVRRLMKLARLLANDDVLDDAPEQAMQLLVEVLQAAYERLRGDETFKAIVEEKGRLEVRAAYFELGLGIERDEIIELDISSEDKDRLFGLAGRRLNEGLYKAWWKSRVDEDPAAIELAKLEAFGLAIDPEVLKDLQDQARAKVQEWLAQCNADIGALTEGDRQKYDEIRALATDPEVVSLSYPGSIEVKRSGEVLNGHLYCDVDGSFPDHLNRWEEVVVREQLQRNDFVGWIRNPDRKAWSFTVPYESGGATKSMYPDFLVVREVNNSLVVDILDPHSLSLADAPDKARGLAKFAAKHADSFGRIELIIVDGDAVKRLDLKDEALRARVAAVASIAHLTDLFRND